MAEQDGDKSQEATPHRRQQAREEGQVFKSQDLASAVLLILGVVTLMMTGDRLLEFFRSLAVRQLAAGVRLTMAPGDATAEWWALVGELSRAMLPLVGLLLLGAVVVDLGQVGFLFLPEKALPDLSRIDPLAGARRLFSLANVVRLAFGIFKVLVVATVAGISVYHQRQAICELGGRSLPEIGAYCAEVLLWTSLKIAIALAVLAVLDYGFQWWKYEQDLRMTPQEVREELKNLEGNPQILARRRSVQRQIVQNRIMEAVPKADAVITNPTELAVAIQYDPEKMRAPIVVAKGAGLIAERIRRIALEHGIPIIEKKPLAQALYREVEVNHPIPQDKYAAVAEVLAYVYQLKGKRIPAGTAA